MYLAFIVNPAAGNGYALRVQENLETVLCEKGAEYRMFRTERRGHGTELAAQLAAFIEEVLYSQIIKKTGEAVASPVCCIKHYRCKTLRISAAPTEGRYCSSPVAEKPHFS